MKLTKKKVLVAALAICLIAIISMGTLAWFSDSDYVENTFKIATSEDDQPDEIFSIDVWENTPDGDRDDDGYEYTDILPGDVLKKEVRVENTGYYDQYMRVIVTISDAQEWLSIADELGIEATDIFGGFEATKWTHVWNNLIENPNAEDLIYVFYHKDIVAKDEIVEVFDTINIPKKLTQEQAAKLLNCFNVSVRAQAVQVENVVPAGTAAEDAAWKAFATVGLDINA